MSSSTLTERLGRFARRAHDAGCDVELHHQSRGLVARIDRGEAVTGDELEQIARDHAAALHGRQGYELRAVYEEGRNKEALPFRMAGESSEEDAAPEAANEKGLLATVVRQNERLLTSVERMHKPLVEALETLGKIVHQHQGQQAEIFKSQVEIAAMTAERDAEKRRDEMSRVRWISLERRFGPIADAVLSKMLPGSIRPEDKAAEFAASLTSEQRAAIWPLLTAAQQELASSGAYATLLASLIETGIMDRVMPLLRPEQIAMLDALFAATSAASNGKG